MHPNIGAANGAAKLTDEQVIQARADYASGTSITALARRYGVVRQTIYYAVTGETWPNLPGASHRARIQRRAPSHDQATVDRVRRLHDEGASFRKIARDSGVSRDTVRRMVQGTGGYGGMK